jgi:hypothetical protein
MRFWEKFVGITPMILSFGAITAEAIKYVFWNRAVLNPT